MVLLSLLTVHYVTAAEPFEGLPVTSRGLPLLVSVCDFMLHLLLSTKLQQKPQVFRGTAQAQSAAAKAAAQTKAGVSQAAGKGQQVGAAVGQAAVEYGGAAKDAAIEYGGVAKDKAVEYGGVAKDAADRVRRRGQGEGRLSTVGVAKDARRSSTVERPRMQGDRVRRRGQGCKAVEYGGVAKDKAVEYGQAAGEYGAAAAGKGARAGLGRRAQGRRGGPGACLGGIAVLCCTPSSCPYPQGY